MLAHVKLKNFQWEFQRNSWSHVQEGQPAGGTEITMSCNNDCFKVWLRQDWHQSDIYLKENCNRFAQPASSKGKKDFFP